MRVGLVACSARKRESPWTAGDIYLGLAFKAGRELLRRSCAEWRVLSALHRVLSPEQVIAPYNTRLTDLGTAEYNAWVEEVGSTLRRKFLGATFVVVAGSEYRVPLSGASIVPAGIERLGIGSQVKRLREAVVRDRRVLVVGCAPARSSRPGARAFVGSASGAHLERLLGLQPGELGTVADTANLHPEYPGPASAGNGDAEPPLAAIQDAAAVLDLSGYDRLILCGRVVAEAFRCYGEFLDVREVRGLPALLLPHPSRVSRWWNEGQNVALARRALDAFAPFRRGLL